MKRVIYKALMHGMVLQTCFIPSSSFIIIVVYSFVEAKTVEGNEISLELSFNIVPCVYACT